MKIAIAVLMKMQWLLPEIGNSRIRLILKKKKKAFTIGSTNRVFRNAREGVAAEHCEHGECCQEAGEYDTSGRRQPVRRPERK